MNSTDADEKLTKGRRTPALAPQMASPSGRRGSARPPPSAPTTKLRAKRRPPLSPAPSSSALSLRPASAAPGVQPAEASDLGGPVEATSDVGPSPSLPRAPPRSARSLTTASAAESPAQQSDDLSQLESYLGALGSRTTGAASREAGTRLWRVSGEIWPELQADLERGSPPGPSPPRPLEAQPPIFVVDGGEVRPGPQAGPAPFPTGQAHVPFLRRRPSAASPNEAAARAAAPRSHRAGAPQIPALDTDMSSPRRDKHLSRTIAKATDRPWLEEVKDEKAEGGPHAPREAIQPTRRPSGLVDRRQSQASPLSSVGIEPTSHHLCCTTAPSLDLPQTKNSLLDPNVGPPSPTNRGTRRRFWGRWRGSST